MICREARQSRPGASRRPRAEILESRTLLAAVPPAGAPYISEFLALNGSGITDLDGDRSDWIEVRNPSPAPANLDGYYEDKGDKYI